MSGVWCTRGPHLFRFTFQTARLRRRLRRASQGSARISASSTRYGLPGSRQTNAIALFLCGAGCAVVLEKNRIARKKNRGRAGRQGSNWTRGPRRLATSRLVEVLCASPCTLVRAKRQSVPQVRQTQGVPRAVFSRSAPRRSPVGGRLCALRLTLPLRTRHWAGAPLTGAPAYRPSGPSTRRRRAGSFAAWTAGPSHRISDARSCPGHRSPPRVWRR
jgi:hypothetical protein